MGPAATQRAAKSSNPCRMPIVAAALVGSLALALSCGGAAAQESVFVGTRTGGDVTVDLKALDQLGPAPRLPSGLAAGEVPHPGPIVVHPPAHTPPPRKVATKAPKAKRPAPEKELAGNTPGISEASAPPPPPPPASDLGKAPAMPSPAPAATAQPSAPPAPMAAASPPPEPAKAPEPTKSAPTAPPAAQASPPPSPAPSPAPKQVASAPAEAPIPAGPLGKPSLSVNFAAGATDLGADDKTALTRIVDALKKNPAERVELLAYASGGADDVSQSRRTSLIRGLSVRTYLIEQGISSARIDVRALGNKVEGSGPADRVDLVLTGQ